LLRCSLKLQQKKRRRRRKSPGNREKGYILFENENVYLLECWNEICPEMCMFRLLETPIYTKFVGEKGENRFFNTQI